MIFFISSAAKNGIMEENESKEVESQIPRLILI